MRFAPLLVLAVLLAAPAQAGAAPQSGKPRLREAAVTVDRHHRAVVDVVAELPNAGPPDLGPDATNRGILRFTLRERGGKAIARGSDSVDLPLDVQLSDHIVQTFRIDLGPGASRRVREAGAKTVQVDATVRSVVDANGGAGTGGVSSVQASDTLDADVSTGPAPSRWQYFQSNFSTDPNEFGITTCDLPNDNCQINFKGGDQPATPPFSQQGVDGTLSYNRWDSDPAGMKSWTLSLHTGSHEGLLHGYTSPDYSKAELPITAGIVRDWGSTAVRSGTTEKVATPGGPLYIYVDYRSPPFPEYHVHIWGYLRCEDVDCTIPALEQPR
jgi:hypothetical protein